MITHVPAAPGSIAHWEINDPTMTMIETVQLVNRSGLIVSTHGPHAEQKKFQRGDPVAIVLPTGNWLVETSSDGVKWFTETSLSSVSGSQRVNFILDGQPMDLRYGRYTKQG